MSPGEVKAVIAAASCERDRLLLRVLWATGGRISEVLALRPRDVQRNALVLPNRKNPNVTTKRVFLPASEADLPGDLLVWAGQKSVGRDEPLFRSQKKTVISVDGRVKREWRAIQRGQAWLIVKQASERANVRVLALRASKDGAAGEAAPVHPHLFRHARVRQIVRETKNLPLAQRQAGWSRLQLAYLSIGDEEARELVAGMQE